MWKIEVRAVHEDGPGSTTYTASTVISTDVDAGLIPVTPSLLRAAALAVADYLIATSTGGSKL